jgi:hypothetical protein
MDTTINQNISKVRALSLIGGRHGIERLCFRLKNVCSAIAKEFNEHSQRLIERELNEDHERSKRQTRSHRNEMRPYLYRGMK